MLRFVSIGWGSPPTCPYGSSKPPGGKSKRILLPKGGRRLEEIEIADRKVVAKPVDARTDVRPSPVTSQARPARARVQPLPVDARAPGRKARIARVAGSRAVR